MNTWSLSSGIPHAVCRLGNVYGPRQSPHGEAGRGRDLRPPPVHEAGRPTLYGHGAPDARLRLRRRRRQRPAGAARHGGHLQHRDRRGNRRDRAMWRELLSDAAGKQIEPELADLRPGELQHSCLDVSARRARARVARRGRYRRRGCALTYEALVEEFAAQVGRRRPRAKIADAQPWGGAAAPQATMSSCCGARPRRPRDLAAPLAATARRPRPSRPASQAQPRRRRSRAAASTAVAGERRARPRHGDRWRPAPPRRGPPARRAGREARSRPRRAAACLTSLATHTALVALKSGWVRTGRTVRGRCGRTARSSAAGSYRVIVSAHDHHNAQPAAQRPQLGRGEPRGRGARAGAYDRDAGGPAGSRSRRAHARADRRRRARSSRSPARTTSAARKTLRGAPRRLHPPGPGHPHGRRHPDRRAARAERSLTTSYQAGRRRLLRRRAHAHRLRLHVRPLRGGLARRHRRPVGDRGAAALQRRADRRCDRAAPGLRDVGRRLAGLGGHPIDPLPYLEAWEQGREQGRPSA